MDGVTHAMRTKEYELRNELYFEILHRLGLRRPEMIEFSRLEFEGVPVSKRKIRPLIDNGTIQSWDDPTSADAKVLQEKGLCPAAIRKFVLSLGITLAETKPPFEALEAFNRKIIDPSFAAAILRQEIPSQLDRWRQGSKPCLEKSSD